MHPAPCNGWPRIGAHLRLRGCVRGSVRGSVGGSSKGCGCPRPLSAGGVGLSAAHTCRGEVRGRGSVMRAGDGTRGAKVAFVRLGPRACLGMCVAESDQRARTPSRQRGRWRKGCRSWPCFTAEARGASESTGSAKSSRHDGGPRPILPPKIVFRPPSIRWGTQHWAQPQARQAGTCSGRTVAVVWSPGTDSHHVRAS